MSISRAKGLIIAMKPEVEEKFYTAALLLFCSAQENVFRK
jgi:hypothetical protein